MLKINVEIVQFKGHPDVFGFTDDRVSFLHLTQEEFEGAEKIGSLEAIEMMNEMFYRHLK
jgi:hypothetical protein